MKCTVCFKKAEVTYDGFTFCLKHYKGSQEYPDPLDIQSYIKDAQKKKKEKRS